jgi:segregation and condensation protein B
MISLEGKLEAILFYKSEVESIQRLATLLDVTEEEVTEAAHALSASLATRGIRVLNVHNELELVTAPETSDLIQAIRKEELVRDLGRAGSETLAIILYRGPVTRATIDHVRGVNSSFIVRNLMIRGLVERVQNPDNARSVLYRPTPQLLAELGITRVEELPDFESIRTEVASFEARSVTEAEQESMRTEHTDTVHVTPPQE